MEKNPNLAKDSGMTVADVKKAYIPQGDKDNGQTQDEVEQRYNDIGKTPIV